MRSRPLISSCGAVPAGKLTHFNLDLLRRTFADEEIVLPFDVLALSPHPSHSRRLSRSCVDDPDKETNWRFRWFPAANVDNHVARRFCHRKSAPMAAAIACSTRKSHWLWHDRRVLHGSFFHLSMPEGTPITIEDAPSFCGCGAFWMKYVRIFSVT
jgi:hypothetical protein